MVTVLWTCSDRFGHAVSTSLHGLPPNFTHALKICLRWLLSPFRSARLMGSGGNSPSSRFNWRKVWTGVKCNFSSAYRHNQYVVGKLSISRVRMWNFTRIGPKTKKLWLLIIPARRLSEQLGLGPPQKRCELQLFFAGIGQAVNCWRALNLGSLHMQFQQDWPKDKKITALLIFWRKTEKFRSTELYGAPLEGSTIFL